MIALIHSLHNCKQLFVNEQAINACLSLYAALLLGYTIHFIYCIWGNLRITVAELIAASGKRVPHSAAISSSDRWRQPNTAVALVAAQPLVAAVLALAAPGCCSSL